MRESELERILVGVMRAAGGRAYKWVSPGNDGVPDRIVIFPGFRPVFVELKTERGRVSAQQKIQINRLRKLGQDVEVVFGIMGLIAFFRKRGLYSAADDLTRKYMKG